jgi:hypothetical protein
MKNKTKKIIKKQFLFNPNNPNKPKLGGESRRPAPWPKETKSRTPGEATEAHRGHPGPRRPPRPKQTAQEAQGRCPGLRRPPRPTDTAGRGEPLQEGPEGRPNRCCRQAIAESTRRRREHEQTPAKAPCVAAGAPIQNTVVAFSAPLKHCTIGSKQHPGHLPEAR